MGKFELRYQPLRADAAELGEAAVVPWDSEQFGFNVGAYRAPADRKKQPPPANLLRAELDRWMDSHDVRLLAAMIPGDGFAWSAVLTAAGFAFVDFSLTAFARRLSPSATRSADVRLAEPADESHLVEIAGSAFGFGRYHADAQFPRALADERYRRWIRNAVAAQSDHEWVFVCGSVGSPTGFLHATLIDGLADLRLFAVDGKAGGGLLGTSLFAGALAQLAARGARQAKAKISAGNLPVLNLYGGAGFAFIEAEMIFHRHVTSVADRGHSA